MAGENWGVKMMQLIIHSPRCYAFDLVQGKNGNEGNANHRRVYNIDLLIYPAAQMTCSTFYIL